MEWKYRGFFYMKILLSGCAGAMGRKIIELISENEKIEIIAGVDKKLLENSIFPVFEDFNKCNITADVIIDFSHPDALDNMLKYATTNNTPIVLCTTGYTDIQKEKIIKSSKNIPIFMSQNMSQGISLMIELIKQSSSFLENFDIEIVEKHHNKKADAPSGTAFMLADAINEVSEGNKNCVYGRKGNNAKREKNEIGIHSLRGGTIVGEHQVHFIGNDEVIEIRHSAYSKNIFAEGALKAAGFILKKPAGLYDMKSMIQK